MARHINRVEDACGPLPEVLWDKALASNGITLQRSSVIQGGARLINGIFGTDIPILDSYDADPAAAEATIAAYADCSSNVQYETLSVSIFKAILGDTSGSIDFIIENKELLSNI
jgi:hypothetical protein